MAMRKFVYYNFFPTKSEEEAAVARGISHQVSRSVMERFDPYYRPTRFEPANPWQIKRVLTKAEVNSGNLVLSQDEVIDYVFNFWGKEVANCVVQGTLFSVTVMDYTDENMVKRFQGENIYLKTGPGETYHLGIAELVKCRGLQFGDEIGLFWDTRSHTFGFKLFRRGNNILNSSVVV